MGESQLDTDVERPCMAVMKRRQVVGIRPWNIGNEYGTARRPGPANDRIRVNDDYNDETSRNAGEVLVQIDARIPFTGRGSLGERGELA